jgi:hypothetical protein
MLGSDVNEGNSRYKPESENDDGELDNILLGASTESFI